MYQHIRTFAKGSGIILCSFIITISLSDKSYGQGFDTGYGFGIEAWNTFSSGIEFTPQQDCSFNDIILKNIQYSDSAVPPQNGTLILCLAAEDVLNSQTYNLPGPTISTAGATINPSLNNFFTSEYVFNMSASMQANTEYWLWIYVQSPDGYNQVHGTWDGIYSIQSIGSSSALNVTIDGSIGGADGWDSSSYQALDQTTTISPSETIPVPETKPSLYIILALSVLTCLGVEKKRGFWGKKA